MSQLETPEVSALEGASVEIPAETTTETAAPNTETTPVDPLAAMYPDDTRPDEPEQEEETPDEPQGDEDEAANEDDEPDEPAIDPPHSWNAEAKAHWDALPRDTQEYLRQRDQEQTQFVNAKAREADTAKKEIQQQALSEVAQFREQQAAQIRQLAAQFLPSEPDRRLLYTGNPQDQLTYQQQRDQYEVGLAQQRELQQMAADELTQAQQIREQQEAQARQVDIERLNDALPELFDEAKGPAIQAELTSVAKALGYPDDLLPEANAADVLALKTASEWKSKADKWDAHQAARMAGVRAAKKQPPTPNKPGSPATMRKAPVDRLKAQYPND